MNEVFLDTETTGLSFREGHKIVEIACIETRDLIATGKVFHKLINPKRNVPEEAFKVHGFSEKYLSDKETFDQVADEFLNFIQDKKIIIHNASFDLSFLDGELGLIKKKQINKKFVIDSLEVARNKFPGISNSLDARFGDTIWRWSYDYPVKGKRDISNLDDENFVILRRKRNRAVTIMYWIFFLSFLIFMSFISKILFLILN